jgi:hypothetical protein
MSSDSRLVVAAYRGIGAISRAIRFQTRSRWSHVGLLWAQGSDPSLWPVDGQLIEAWHKGGVRLLPGAWVDHDPRTAIDIFGLPEMAPTAQAAAWRFAVLQVGNPYDFRNVFRFVSRRTPSEDGKWFCSELVAASCEYAGYPLLRRLPPAATSPAMVVWSPRLDYLGTAYLDDGQPHGVRLEQDPTLNGLVLPPALTGGMIA